MKSGKLQIRVYYEDTDCGNVVYYANYLRYMERARTELLREHGIELVTYHEKGILFAVIEADIKYRTPARYNDLLDLETRMSDISTVSLTFHTDICNCAKQLLVTGDVRIACVNTKGKASRIPVELLEKLKA